MCDDLPLPPSEEMMLSYKHTLCPKDYRTYPRPQVEDLKIGNWVYLYSKNRLFQITSGYEIDTGCESGDFGSIPLTSDALRNYRKGRFFRFGNSIKAIVVQEHETKLSFIQADNKQSYMPFFEDRYGGIMKLKNIHYLHELQNLVKELTGKDYDVEL